MRHDNPYNKCVLKFNLYAVSFLRRTASLIPSICRSLSIVPLASGNFLSAAIPCKQISIECRLIVPQGYFNGAGSSVYCQILATGYSLVCSLLQKGIEHYIVLQHQPYLTGEDRESQRTHLLCKMSMSVCTNGIEITG